MRHHHPFGDGDCRNNQSMKGLRGVVLGSIAGSLLGAAAFFAVDAIRPDPAGAATICRKDYAGRDVITGSDGSRQACRTNYAGHCVCG